MKKTHTHTQKKTKTVQFWKLSWANNKKWNWRDINLIHRIHEWYICPHLVDFYSTCRQIYQSHGSVMGILSNFPDLLWRFCCQSTVLSIFLGSPSAPNLRNNTPVTWSNINPQKFDKLKFFPKIIEALDQGISGINCGTVYKFSFRDPILSSRKHEIIILDFFFPWRIHTGLVYVRTCFFNDLLLLHPPKQTWNLKMDPWKRRFLLETTISRFHVNFWGCKCSWIYHTDHTWIRHG